MAIKRQELKSDEFVSFLDEIYEWYLNRQHEVLTYGSVIVAAALLIGGVYYVHQHREQQASNGLSQALQTQSGQLGSPQTPALEKENATKAQKQLQAVFQSYGGTPAGKLARYDYALTQLQTGDEAGAESTLKQVVNKGGAAAGLARIALANLYQGQNHLDLARKELQDAVAHPTPLTPKAESLMLLAQLEGQQDRAAAAKLYQQVKTEYPNTQIADLASEKLQQLNQTPAQQ